ncbi:tail fiber assembly protein [Pseudomonas putida]|uniref:tail fiber assembly protein n=1 Tax=Pseudomonas putida TaxID=303 RepID=UPI00301B999F
MSMKYLKDPTTGEVFAFEADGSQDDFIPIGLIALTEAEVEAHLAPPVLSPEQLAEIALNERDALLAQAAIRIAPLQDAVDLGEASAAEEQALIAWKRYRVAVNRIDQQAGFPGQIDWPVPPA